MERKEETGKAQQEPMDSRTDGEKQNPFKETSAPEPAETPEEEAAAEQQRKEALTERD